MSAWDSGTVRSVPQGLERSDRSTRAPHNAAGRLDLLEAQRRFSKFLREFRIEHEFIYRDSLDRSYKKHSFALELQLAHLAEYSEDLHDCLLSAPNEYLPVFEHAAHDVMCDIENEPRHDLRRVPPVQITLTGELAPTHVRDISAADINRLVSVPGIVINASRTRPKASAVMIYCPTCGDRRALTISSAFGAASIPRRCPLRTIGPDGVETDNPQAAACGLDPYTIQADDSTYMDTQTLKLQETPEDVPTGEMPRHMLLSADRTLADVIAPGTRVRVLGIVSTFTAASGRGNTAAAVRTPYIRVVGWAIEQSGAGRVAATFTPEEESRFKELAQSKDWYQSLAASVAPAIKGDYTEDIKRAILALLVGGSRKTLPDGVRLRGDVNVLLLGDPSTAKSQFLKFVEKVAPVGVYTSGKGSSAAGLTASVIRDSKGEFYLEGGALVLADGGVVCIDEFDKMREEDRVAIHEAMEQQTISVAKAGITTVLNSRAAVLAAANPVYGRYDDERSAAENIDFLPTILSRFDLIFIVRDVRNMERDMSIARHVISVHINASSGVGGEDMEGAAQTAEDEDVDVPITEMKRFIAYARTKCAPRLSASAASMLQEQYVKIRKEQRTRANAAGAAAASSGDAADAKASVIPITVRQLEALVRISEAIAKTTLSPEATEAHVTEAMRLFKVSTLDAAASGLASEVLTKDMKADVAQIMKRVHQMMGVGTFMRTANVRAELLRRDFSGTAIRIALERMVNLGDLEFINERRTVKCLKHSAAEA